MRWGTQCHGRPWQARYAFAWVEPCVADTISLAGALAIAHARFKQAFLRGEARDAMPSVQVDPRLPIIPVRALQNEGTRRFVEFQHEVVARFRGPRELWPRGACLRDEDRDAEPQGNLQPGEVGVR